MHGIRFKTWLVFLFIPAILIPVLLMVYNLFLVMNTGMGKPEAPKELLELVGVIKVQVFVILVLTVIIVSICYLMYKSILYPLLKIKDGVNAIKKGDSSYRLKIGSRDEIGEIALAFNEMACSLESQASELYDRNWELEEANSQLEASYGQLQATIEQLNEAEQKYHSLIQNIPEVVCVIQENGLVSFVNHVCSDMLGYEKSELTGSSIMKLINFRKAGNLAIDKLVEELRDKNSLTIELPLVRKDGKSIITEANLTNYRVNGINMGIQAIVRDITQKKKMEEEIIQTNKDLAILNSVSKSLTSILDLDDLSKLIVKQIADAFNYPVCILRMLDRTGTHLVPKAFSGSYFKGIRNVMELGSIDVIDETMDQVINYNEIMKITDIPKGWIVGRINEQKTEKERIKEILMVPVSVKGKKFGVLSVGSTSSIKPRDMDLISSVANNSAVAIDNSLLYETSKKYFIRTIDALIAAVEAKDSYTEGHSQRVSKYAVEIASRLGLSKDQIEDIKIAGILHDIGKIGISDSILSKPGKLTEDEYQEVKQHPAISNKILYPVGFSERALKAIAFHHERFDGKGYPFGLAGDDITIEAQIIAVADAFDAMTSSRSYRCAMSREDAIKELLANKNTQFSSRAVDAFVASSAFISST